MRRAFGDVGARKLMKDKSEWLNVAEQGIESIDKYVVMLKRQAIGDLLGSTDAANNIISRCPGVLETTIPKLMDSISVLQSVWGTSKKKLEVSARTCPEILLVPGPDLTSVTAMLKDILAVDVAPLLLERPIFLTKQKRMENLWTRLREEHEHFISSLYTILNLQQCLHFQKRH